MTVVTKDEGRPVRTRPARSRDTDFFWQGASEGKLLFQQCRSCGLVRHPPTAVCPQCHSIDVEYVESTRRGTIYTYTVHHYPPIPGFSAPFCVAVADMEEGVRLVANLDAPIDSVRIGLPVVVEFEPQPDGWSVPIFRPSDVNETTQEAGHANA